MQIFQIEDSL